MRKHSVVVMVLALVVLLCGVGCTDVDQQKAAQAAQDASAIIKAFQSSEILAHQQGFIPDDDHVFIQKQMLTIAQSGKQLDSCIRVAKSNAGVVQCVAGTIQTVEEVQMQGGLFLKSDRAKTDFTLAMIGAKSALQVLSAVYGGAK